MASESDLQKIVARLEAAAARIEAAASGSFSSSSAGSSSSGGGSSGPEAAGWLAEYDAFITEHVDQYAALSESIGGDVALQAKAVHDAFTAQRAFLAIVATCAKPADSVRDQLLGPTGAGISRAIEIRESKRGSPVFDHLTAVAEGVPALGWVQVSPLPAPHVEQMGQAAEFSLNKVQKAHKEDVDKVHINWVKTNKDMWKALFAFVKKNHTTGLVWTPRGDDASKYVGGGAPPAAAAAAPAPAASSSAASSKAKAPAVTAAPAGLFDEVSKGEGVTSGLKKVTPDMKTKNRTEPTSSVVPAAAAEKKAGSSSKSSRSKNWGEPVASLAGNRWTVQYQSGNQSIQLNDVLPKHTVYICDCENSVIQIGGKVNAVTLDGCFKVGLVFTNVITGCELVNCNGVRVQVLEKVPNFAIDKTSDVQLYLPSSSLETEIVTSMSDEVNVNVPGATPETDLIEIALPKQFKSRYDAEQRRMITEAVQHI